MSTPTSSFAQTTTTEFCRFLDEPWPLYRERMCLLPVSKDLNGHLGLIVSNTQHCDQPPCETYKTNHLLQLDVTSAPCDSDQSSACLNGPFMVPNLVHALIDTGLGRGPHTGDLMWEGECMTVVGEMSGMTNIGTHRDPAFDPCQTCDEVGVMEGRLVGRIVEAEREAFVGCCVTAVYRIKFTPSEDFHSVPEVEGTLEGVIICPCNEHH